MFEGQGRSLLRVMGSLKSTEVFLIAPITQTEPKTLSCWLTHGSPGELAFLASWSLAFSAARKERAKEVPRGFPFPGIRTENKALASEEAEVQSAVVALY